MFKFLRLRVALGLALAPLGVGASGALADSPGAVYSLTNDPAGNAVQVFQRGGDGSLTPGGEFALGLADGGELLVRPDGRPVALLNDDRPVTAQSGYSSLR